MASRASVEPVTYSGWSHNLRLCNEEVEVVITLDVGPRVIRYARVGGENALYERPGELGHVGEPVWVMRGGHRLWVSGGHGSAADTHVPDNQPVQHHVEGGRVRVWNRPDPALGVEKSLELELAPTGSELKITHRFRNAGDSATTLAMGAVTVLPPGGEAFVPLADGEPGPILALSPAGAYKDDRVKLGASWLRLRQGPADAHRATGTEGDVRIGVRPGSGSDGSVAPMGAAYVRSGLVFAKRFGTTVGTDDAHTRSIDVASSLETFTDGEKLELAWVGPQITLGPRPHSQGNLSSAQHSAESGSPLLHESVHEFVHIERWTIDDVDHTGFPGVEATEVALSSYFARIFGRDSEKIR